MAQFNFSQQKPQKSFQELTNPGARTVNRGQSWQQYGASKGITPPAGVDPTAYIKSRVKSQMEADQIKARMAADPTYGRATPGQGYAPSYQNLRLAAAQDVLSGQPNGGAPDWARNASIYGRGAPSPNAAPAPTYSAQPPGLRYSPEDMQRELRRIREEGLRWNSGSRPENEYRRDVLNATNAMSARPEYMQNQSAFERMRAQSVYNLLGRRPNARA